MAAWRVHQAPNRVGSLSDGFRAAGASVLHNHPNRTDAGLGSPVGLGLVCAMLLLEDQRHGPQPMPHPPCLKSESAQSWTHVGHQPGVPTGACIQAAKLPQVQPPRLGLANKIPRAASLHGLFSGFSREGGWAILCCTLCPQPVGLACLKHRQPEILPTPLHGFEGLFPSIYWKLYRNGPGSSKAPHHP